MSEEKMERNMQSNEKGASAQPEELPELTFWPIVLAVGVVCLFWGFITSLIISGMGLAITGTALFGWLEEFRDD
jgi:hypothetical protein